MSESIYQPTPRQIRTGEVCAICRHLPPPPDRSCCDHCMPPGDDEKSARIRDASEASRASTNLSMIALSILEQFTEWKAEAEQICQCEQSDEPFVPFMLGKLTSLLGEHFGPMKAEVRMWKAREQQSYRNVLRVNEQLKSTEAAIVRSRQGWRNAIELGILPTRYHEEAESIIQELTVALVAIGSEKAVL